MTDTIIVNEEVTHVVTVSEPGPQGPEGPEGPPGSGGGGGGAVDSVNGETGDVVLDPEDVGAAAASHNHDDRYFTEAEVTTALAAKQDASTAATDAELSAHESDTTNVHGIADTSALATDSEVATAISQAISNLINGAPGALDTLDELAAALGDDANFAATVTSALADKQPLDSDLTAIAALTTTSFGRSLLEAANAGAARTLIDAAASSHNHDASYQPLDSDLTAIAALSTTSTGRSLLAAADAAAIRTISGAQATDADLDAIAALSPSNDDVIQRKSGAWTNRTLAQLKSDLGIAAAGEVNGPPLFVRKTADETVNNSAALQDDDALLVALGANQVWYVEAFLRLASANVNPDWQFGWTGPTGATAHWGVLSISTNTLGNINAGATNQTPQAELGIGDVTQIGSGNVIQVAVLAGLFLSSSTTGNLRLRWAQNTANASDSTVKANSFLRATRLA